jgi:hypothetical protein
LRGIREKYSDGVVALILADNIRNACLYKVDNSELPNAIKATLPATGEYCIIVAEQPDRVSWKKLRRDYRLTLEAPYETCRTLEPSAAVE